MHPGQTLLPDGTALLVGGTDRCEHDSTDIAGNGLEHKYPRFRGEIGWN
jgi:hypothetical protein